MTASQSIDIFPDVPGSNCRSWPAGDGGLTADHFLRMYPAQTVGAELARDGGLIADRYLPDAPNQTVGVGLPAMAA